MKTDIETFLKSGAYLPAPLRDFHDAKDVFKAVHAGIDPASEGIKRVSWIDGHCYVVDIFLWFMARRGWTLQRSRVDADFRDLAADIETHRKQEAEAFSSFMAKHNPLQNPPKTFPESR